MSDRLTTEGVGWGLFGLALLAVVAWVGYAYLGWLVLGLFTYYVARPITRRLQRYVPSRSLAAGLTLVCIIVPILVFLGAFLGIVVGQALSVLSSSAGQSIVSKLPLASSGLPTDPVDAVSAVLADPTLSKALDQFGVALGAFAATLFNVFLSLIFAFFLLLEDDRLSRWVRANVLGTDSMATDYLRRVDRGLTSVYFGYTLTIFAVIVMAAVIYLAFNAVAPGRLTIPSSLLLAVVTGVFTLIPLVGRSIVYAFIVALLALQAINSNRTLLWVPAVFFLFMVVVFDNLVRTYVRPYLSGKTYHMGLVMFAYLLGPALFGWYGIFLGPLLMVFVVEFVANVLPVLADVDAEPDQPLLEPRLDDFETGTSGEGVDADAGDVQSG